MVFSEDLLADYLKHRKHTSPGKDGVHCFAWKYGNRLTFEYLRDLFLASTCSTPKPVDLNDGVMVFAPKGSAEDDFIADPHAVFRRPEELRPLTLKNEDNKTVAGVTNWIITPVVAKSSSKLQNGFKRDCQLTQNVVDLDFESRKQTLLFQGRFDKFRYSEQLILNREGLVNSLPVLMLYDYAAAFPSVSHAWLFMVLNYINIPLGLMNTINALYTGNSAFQQGREGLVWLFGIISGVLQGCPLSGSLFVICIDPLLYAFDRYVQRSSLGIVRACADDIGACLAGLTHLPIIFRLFEEFRLLSGLCLKPKKCVMVLLSVEASIHNIAIIRTWLSRNLPQWKDIEISNVGKYLGLMVGPNAGVSQWNAATRKFLDRVAWIHNACLPPHLAAARYNSHAIPILGYIGQLVPPPKKYKILALDAVGSVLRLPGRSLDYPTAHCLEELGGPKLVDLIAYVNACCVRASIKMFTGFQEQSSLLKELALQHNLLCFVNKVATKPHGWDSEAFCFTLTSAYNSEVGSFIRENRESLRGSIQRNAYQRLKDNKGAWTSILTKRINMFCVPEVEVEVLETVPHGVSTSSSSTDSSSSDVAVHLPIRNLGLVVRQPQVSCLGKAIVELTPGPRMCLIKTLKRVGYFHSLP